MPAETVALVSAIVAVFFVFGITLAWAARVSGRL
jgi:hypothetical protein